ncbi:MAG: phosphatidylglycerophosphatase A [bacterium]|nr:phosphatidylglycerophosphatase A [bacterium]
MKSRYWKSPPDLTGASPLQRVSYFIASTFYTGSLPASGTWGALVAWAVHAFFLPHWFTWQNAPLAALTVAVIILIGTGCSEIIERMTGVKDDSRITVDEVAGYALAVLFVPAGLEYSIPAFLLARFFDILKPPPANALQELHGGIGIMLDDLIASVYALALMHVYAYLGLGEALRQLIAG